MNFIWNILVKKELYIVMDRSNLANRMKEYEKRNQYYLQKRIPVAIRVDGRSFHTFTKGFERPFDKVLIKSMQETAKYMCENIQGAKFAYIQSDEITIILTDYDTLETDCWFNYRTDKLCSIAASMATMKFNKVFDAFTCGVRQGEDGNAYVRAKLKGAMFDARVFNIPKEEVTNLIYWRQLDAIRNSIQMVGQANFSHKELQKKSCSEIQDMLMSKKGINWNDFPTDQKQGSCCIKKWVSEDVIVAGEPAFPRQKCLRPHWVVDKEIPIFKDENRNYIERLLENEIILSE